MSDLGPIDEPEIVFDRDKFLAALHYICAAFADAPEQIGRTKLHKILYFSDMLLFASTGKPLTGVDYIKQQYGPTARHLTWGLDALHKRGDIEISTEDYFGLAKLHVVTCTSPNSNLLSEEERALLDDVIAFVRGRSAKEISELSHQAPWEAVEIGQRIPYFSSFLLVPIEVTDEDTETALQDAQAMALGQPGYAR